MAQDRSASAGRESGHTSRHANPIDAHVGNRLRLRRMALGLSQEQLAEPMGLTFQQIQKYEKGANRISASRLYGFAQVLSCPVQFFFGDLPSDGEIDGAANIQDGAGDRITEFLRSRDGVTLNEAFSRIGETNVRKAILRLVCSVADGRNSPS